ncbi:hypothetical protein HZH66_012730 [Vespula vulgaris]|uniref:Uncharacterized protein n=1 Tax=Vespula vulgaris TaxID=7454 RepID=A0A834J8I8_VESVU|nr:hypothetical protein HZH66_012730 [Vespula vulgaris]
MKKPQLALSALESELSSSCARSPRRSTYACASPLASPHADSLSAPLYKSGHLLSDVHSNDSLQQTRIYFEEIEKTGNNPVDGSNRCELSVKPVLSIEPSDPSFIFSHHFSSFSSSLLFSAREFERITALDQAKGISKRPKKRNELVELPIVRRGTKAQEK